MDIVYSSIAPVLKGYCDISDTLKRGKEVVDYEVENALLKAALEGNVTAQIFWLKNRKRKAWRDKPELEAAGGGEGGVVLMPEVSHEAE